MTILKIFITRHGQPAIGGLKSHENHETPPGDPALTGLGRRQANFLGTYLAENGFKGRVYSSPYRRTLETAEIIAEAADLRILPEKSLQEYILKVGTPDFAGLDAKSISTQFPHVNTEGFRSPWFFTGPEDDETVYKRVSPFIDALPTLARDFREVLLVGHGATIFAALRRLSPESVEAALEKPGVRNWNCSLSEFTVSTDGSVTAERIFDTAHMPAGLVSSNLRMLKDELK